MSSTMIYIKKKQACTANTDKLTGIKQENPVVMTFSVLLCVCCVCEIERERQKEVGIN